MTKDPELESFKKINLTQYASSLGYVLDKKRSSNTSAVMKLAGDKIVIAIDSSDNHWVFFTVGNNFENGSIIDFVQKSKGGSLGTVRKELRPWVGDRVANVDFKLSTTSSGYIQGLKPSTKDRVQVVLAFEEMEVVENHPYLEQKRLISSELGVN